MSVIIDTLYEVWLQFQSQLYDPSTLRLLQSQKVKLPSDIIDGEGLSFDKSDVTLCSASSGINILLTTAHLWSHSINQFPCNLQLHFFQKNQLQRALIFLCGQFQTFNKQQTIDSSIFYKLSNPQQNSFERVKFFLP